MMEIVNIAERIIQNAAPVNVSYLNYLTSVRKDNNANMNILQRRMLRWLRFSQAGRGACAREGGSFTIITSVDMQANNGNQQECKSDHKCEGAKHCNYKPKCCFNKCRYYLALRFNDFLHGKTNMLT